MHLRVLPYLVLALPMSALAQKAKTATPVIAVPTAPAKPLTSPNAAARPPEGLISSETGGRDLVFLANALDLSRALEYLSAEAAKTTNPGLKSLCDELAKTFPANNAIVATVAEMRNIKIPKESPTQKRLADRLEKLNGPKREKVLVDLFVEIDERMSATYELGKQSADRTILRLSEQAYAQTQEHLFLAQSMAGIATKRPAALARPKAEMAVEKPRPAPPAEAPISEKPAQHTVVPQAAASATAPAPEPTPKAAPVAAPPAMSMPTPAPEVADAPKKPALAPAPKVELPPQPEPAVAKSEPPPDRKPPMVVPVKPESALPPQPGSAPKVEIVDVPKPKPALPPAAKKPAPIAEAPRDDVAPQKLEGEGKSPKRPAFRTNVKPLTD